MKFILLPFLLLANISFAQVNLNVGLRAYYPFTGNANDVSGNNNNPTFNNAVLTADRSGNPNSAYHFNGSTSYMQVPNSPSLNMPTTMSVALWVKPTGFYTGPCYNNILVTKSASTTLPSNVNMRFADIYTGCTTPTTTTERFAGNNTAAATPLIQLNQWYSVVWTSDGINERIYVNCELKITAPAGGVPYSNTFDMFFGKQNVAAFPYWLNGDLDEIRVYDRALTPDEVNVLGGCPLTTSCNNWLNTPVVGSSVKIGDLDISGNQVTVEANFNCSSFPLTRPDKQEDIVSKHANTADINYVLRMDLAGITTTNGQFLTPIPCDNLVTNKTYHVAMVYNGSSLKFYRNGYLMSQIAASGNMILNDWQTTIGDYAVNNPVGTNFVGNINEVRIWNIERTQAQIQTYMDASLPNPTTQTGLLAYYTFDNLLNKQGNAAWNGTLNGAATINQTNANCTFIADSCNVTTSVVASFTAPDTVCVNTPVTITNTSTGASTYYWNFCTANINQPPIGNNIGNPGNKLSMPVYIDYVLTNGNYYGFVTNNSPGGLVRLDFGNSLLNTPTATSLGNIGGAIPNNTEGLQIVQDNGNWYVLIVGGEQASGSIPSLTTVFLGSNINNNSPTATNWGNIGGLAYPHDLYVFNDNGHWFGLTVNFANNTFTRFDLTTSLANTPTAQNLGNIGSLNGPTGIQAINDNGNWLVFVTNALNSTLSRLNFGSSLLNNSPTGVNLGNPNNAFFTCWDINIIKYCGQNQAFVINANTGHNDIIKLDFGSSLLNTPTAVSLGNQGNMNFPHCLSKFFRVGPDVYSLVANVANNSITSLKFAGCTASSIPNSTLATPPPIIYNTPGTYNINLTVDDGLPTQSSFCKQIVVDPCLQQTSSIINDYTPVLALDPCSNTLKVENGIAYNVGDTVLLIQMKGAVIDSTNTAAFGTITDYKNAGNYEFNYIKSKSGNNIELKNVLTRQYDIPVGKVQLIRVPYYNNLAVTDTLTCLPWDGSKGGVLVVNVANTLTLNSDINVSGKGFRGGQPITTPTPFGTFHQADYAYPANPVDGARKGEGIAQVSENLIFCRGPLASGGGGGNTMNAGGGGGSNGGTGGKGGDEWAGSPVPIFPGGGIGGKNIVSSAASNKIFMGGGGGAGHGNDGSATAGGNGSGIVIVNATTVNPNSNKIVADGNGGIACLTNFCADGVGGGGGGGTILINAQTIQSNITIQTNGGKGADNNINGPNAHGTGGGAGGGALLVNSASLFGNINYSSLGGVAGKALNQGGTNWGSTAGSIGISQANVTIPFSTIPFVKNIDSVRIKDSLTSCFNIDFKGLAYINTSAIATWQWFFGDGGTASTQNTSHTYPASATYTVKLVVVDLNGCTDSVTKPIFVNVCNSTIINDYTPVLALNPCNNTLTVENATAYNVGDTVLLIQMKGAIIDSTNSPSFGTITDYKNSGNYEFNYVKSKSGNDIELKNVLTRQYDIPLGKVQLIRVPYYNNFTTNDTLTCLPWDGSKGGVLVFNVLNTLTLNKNIDVSERGFKGAVGYNPGTLVLACAQNQYNYPLNSVLAAQKGESITTISNNIICGKGSPAGGGGGGLGHNSGGGGGGNGGTGGLGGYQLEPCGNAPFDNRGVGGKNLNYSSATNKIFMGSGGGAGHADNPGNIPPAGGNGAGIVIISADKIQSNSNKIIANGAAGLACSIPASTDCHDGMGGGGSGGTVLLNINQYLDNTIIEGKGGKGADMVGPVSVGGRIGAGGGGAGGVAYLSNSSLPANLTTNTIGGANGVLTTDGNNPWGATPGTAGINLYDLILPVDIVPFQKNIDSVRIKDSVRLCNDFDFKGLAYIHTTPVATWLWSFGDGGTANTQNTTHAYIAAGTYTVKLIITDVNGCIDSTMKDVVALPAVNAEAGADTSICTNGSVSVMLHGNAVGGPYSWSPAGLLNNPNIQNPTATISNTTTFYLNVTGPTGCISLDSVTITINPLPLVNTINDTAICIHSTLILTTNSNASSIQWSPAIYVSNPNIANPNYIDTGSHKVYVIGTSALGCMAIDSVDVTVNPLPVVKTISDTTICIGESITLTTTGAQTYSWSPAGGLNNPNVASPLFNSNTGQTYTVTGTDVNGCKNTDMVVVAINTPDSLKQPPSFSICQKQSIQLNGNNGSRVSYLWSPATYLSSNSIINPIANPPQTTVYTLLVTDNKCGFDSTFTTILTVLSAPVINAAKSNDIDCAFHSAVLSASGGNQYLWSPATGLSNATIPNPIAKPSSTQTYIVQVTDASGCKNTDSVTVFIKTGASLARFMPNAFTPDGDGKNDCYGLKNWIYVKKLQFYVFNRYGEQVFGTANPNSCWDGTYKGKPALAGTYVYYIKAQTDCGDEEQKGTFLLIR